jgi:pilus assembly protein Flp/PilA
MGNKNMIDYIKTWASLRTDRRAVTALEYAMIAGIVVAVIAVGFGIFAGELKSQFSSLGTSL